MNELRWPGLLTVFAEPSGEFAGPADRAQPALGLIAHGGGGDDEQPVTGLQRGSGRGNEPLATAGTLQVVTTGIEHEIVRGVRRLAPQDGENLAVLHALDAELHSGRLFNVGWDQVVLPAEAIPCPE